MKRTEHLGSSANGPDPGHRVLARLERVFDRGYGQFFARCPAHDDTNPSLSIKVLDDGRVLLHCFAGCAIVDVLSAIQLEFADLYPNAPTSAQPASIRWNYLDLLLTPLMERRKRLIAMNRRG